MDGTAASVQDGLRCVLASLRLLADTRDDTAAWMLMRHWGASAGLTSALVAGCAHSRLSAWQQVLSWARRGHEPTESRADFLFIGRLVKMTDALQNILEDAPPNLDAGAAAQFLNALLRLPARHAKVRPANQNVVAAAEAIASRVPAVAVALPLEPLSALRALILEANELLAPEPASPDRPIRHAHDGDTAKQVDTGRTAGTGGAASAETLAHASQHRTHVALISDPSDPTAKAPPRVIYAPFASPRTLRLLAAGALQRRPEDSIETTALHNDCIGDVFISAPARSRKEGVKGMRCQPKDGQENPTGRPAAKAAIPGGFSASCRAGNGKSGDTPPAKKQPGAHHARSAKENKNKKEDVVDPNRGALLRYFSKPKVSASARAHA